ncbi:MAG: sigma 54-interacting transcriptional regulator [Thermodesulfobacteriota bacterium]|nr:sigma 54-interacting transcriptional regulator [Thermodesulfobacteriota bacterium]
MKHGQQGYDAAIVEHDIACLAMNRGDMDDALIHFEQVCDLVFAVSGSDQGDALFVRAALDLVRIKLRVIRDVKDVPAYLEKARPLALRMGDLRAQARINLVHGLYFVEVDNREKAMEMLQRGLEQADALGDDDIMAWSAEYRGLYFYIQGRYRQAVEYFDYLVQAFNAQRQEPVYSNLPDYMAYSTSLGYCEALLGDFHRSIGVLDSRWRRARIKGDQVNCSFYQALMGIVLLMMGRRSDAFSHLTDALRQAQEFSNNEALHVAQKGLAYYWFFQGQLDRAYDITRETVHARGIGAQYNWPVTLEMLYAFDLRGYEPIDTMVFEEEMKRVIKGPNFHLRGVALRIRALQAIARGEEVSKISGLLDRSEKDLVESGDPIELGKTRAEMARLMLRQGDEAEAQSLALKAREGLIGYGRDFFPEDLVSLLGVYQPGGKSLDTDNLLGRFMDVMDTFMPGSDKDELHARLIFGMCRFLGADRGGMFWFPDKKDRKNPVMGAVYNLTDMERHSPLFWSSISLITRSYHNQEPLVVRHAHAHTQSQGLCPKSVLCLPIIMPGEISGIMYMDNLGRDDAFDCLDRDAIVRFSRHLSAHMERISQYCRIIRAQKTLAVSEQFVDGPGAMEIITQSPVMYELLKRADHVAASDASVLILGETGVGKELLARRLHRMSNRVDGAFVEVDPGSVPETLFESELFGYEKGAFTGADKRKPGRMELADKGTLFIDEVGDISPLTQVKLLRALQEKGFMRVGATKSTDSDFRLISATNHVLEDEVTEGRFRQDLYYRISVVPLVIPPLRERGEDAVLLADAFLGYFSKKYNRQGLRISKDERARLKGYAWPGNVRELKNVMERSVLLSMDQGLKLDLGIDADTSQDASFSDEPTMDEMQRRYIRHVLCRTKGRIGGPGGAADCLGMKRTTLQARMKRLGISEE